MLTVLPFTHMWLTNDTNMTGSTNPNTKLSMLSLETRGLRMLSGLPWNICRKTDLKSSTSPQQVEMSLLGETVVKLDHCMSDWRSTVSKKCMEKWVSLHLQSRQKWWVGRLREDLARVSAVDGPGCSWDRMGGGTDGMPSSPGKQLLRGTGESGVS